MINQKATKIVFNNHNNKYNILVIMNIKMKINLFVTLILLNFLKYNLYSN
jgi:hypothetical protein